ncbi:MAG: acireductone synthase [Candidatus Parabeggiatoa sp. nov. 1]|nr:MAG: acireductone synthase [Gammaproteobacteria bacterium]
MIEAILTDIEGTTSSLSFVKDVLFPYAKEHLPHFVQTFASNPEVRTWLDATQQEVGKSMSDDEIIQVLLQWIDEDRKTTPLKTLQGLIWEEGYCNGAYIAHMYEDAVRNLRKWQETGKKLFIYSSGSVKAQQLLFAHTEYGDLTPLFSGYFDTTIGHKRENHSYTTIAQAIQMEPAHILFLSDVVAELDAAKAVGVQTCCLVRDTVFDPSCPHLQVKDFDAISLDA